MNPLLRLLDSRRAGVVEQVRHGGEQGFAARGLGHQQKVRVQRHREHIGAGPVARPAADGRAEATLARPLARQRDQHRCVAQASVVWVVLVAVQEHLVERQHGLGVARPHPEEDDAAVGLARLLGFSILEVEQRQVLRKEKRLGREAKVPVFQHRGLAGGEFAEHHVAGIVFHWRVHRGLFPQAGKQPVHIRLRNPFLSHCTLRPRSISVTSQWCHRLLATGVILTARLASKPWHPSIHV
jgi:hypothetical protein